MVTPKKCKGKTGKELEVCKKKAEKDEFGTGYEIGNVFRQYKVDPVWGKDMTELYHNHFPKGKDENEFFDGFWEAYGK